MEPGWLRCGARVGPPAPCTLWPWSRRGTERRGNALLVFPALLDNWEWGGCSGGGFLQPPPAPRSLLGSARSEWDRKVPEGFVTSMATRIGVLGTGCC